MTFPDNSPKGFAGDFMISDDKQAAIQNLRSGRFGSFAAHIGDAAISADVGNLFRLVKAFPELFYIASRN